MVMPLGHWVSMQVCEGGTEEAMRASLWRLAEPVPGERYLEIIDGGSRQPSAALDILVERLMAGGVFCAVLGDPKGTYIGIERWRAEVAARALYFRPRDVLVLLRTP